MVSTPVRIRDIACLCAAVVPRTRPFANGHRWNSRNLLQRYCHLLNHSHCHPFVGYSFLLFAIPVRYLMENEVYSFQVFSLSTNDYQSGSNEYDIRIPPYRIRMRLIAICITLIILFMLVFASIYIYVKKRCFEPYPDADEKLQRA